MYEVILCYHVCKLFRDILDIFVRCYTTIGACNSCYSDQLWVGVIHQTSFGDSLMGVLETLVALGLQLESGI